MKKWIVGLLVLLPAAFAHAAPCSVATSPIDLTSCPERRLSITLANPPSTRARISFDSLTTAKHRELEWDPAVDTSLTRTIVLEAETWGITATIEPVTQPAGSDIAMLAFASKNGLTGGQLEFTYSALAIAKTAGRVSASATTLEWAGPVFTFSVMALPTMDETELVIDAPVASSSKRGAGVLSEGIGEVFSILAEIAVERARAGAMTLLKEQLVDPLCGNDDGTGGVTLGAFKLDGLGLALPRTCVLLASLRLEDILSSGKPLLESVRDDLRGTIVPAALRTIAHGSAWGASAMTVLEIANRIVDRGSFALQDLQAMFAIFADLAPMIDRAELVDPADEDQLVAAIHVATKRAQACEASLGDVACARKLVAMALDSADLRAKLTAMGAPISATLEHAIDRLDAIATHFVATLAPQITALGGTIVGCEGIGDATRCARALARRIRSAADLVELAGRLRLDAKALYPTLLTAVIQPQLATATASSTLLRATSVACEARLAVAVLKVCSRQTCSDGSIAAMFDAPDTVFAEDTTGVAALCWANGKHLFASGRYRSLVVDGLATLEAFRKNEPPRPSALVQMFAKVTLDAANCDVPTVSCRKLRGVLDLVSSLVDKNYAIALRDAAGLLREFAPMPVAFRKGSQLIGTVVAYADVIRDTKDQDPQAARAARKHALEGLIDAATDRTGRDAARIFSIGSNVGLSFTRNDPRGTATATSWDPALRIPLMVNFDWLNLFGSKHLGWHAGLTLADLGQFAAVDADGNVDEVRWTSFLSPGIELGLLVGRQAHPFNITVHAEYAPAAFPHVENDRDVAGAWRVGVSVGYYVPFFDLN